MKKAWMMVAFFALGFIWGGSFLVISFAIKVFPSIWSATFRVILATLLLAVILWCRGSSVKAPRAALFRIWPLGILMIGLPFALLFWGQRYIPPGLAGILNGTVPLWTALFATFSLGVRRKKIPRTTIQGLVAGFLGIILLFILDLHFPIQDQEFIAGMAVLTMAVSYAIGNVLSYNVLVTFPQVPLFTVAFHQHLASGVFLALLSFSSEITPRWEDLQHHPEAVLALVYLATVPSALGYTLFYDLTRTMGAVKVGSIAYLIPVSALFFDFVVNHHIPGWNAIVGTGCILLGLKWIRQ